MTRGITKDGRALPETRQQREERRAAKVKQATPLGWANALTGQPVDLLSKWQSLDVIIFVKLDDNQIEHFGERREVGHFSSSPARRRH